MHIAFPAILIVIIHAAVALEATCRPAEKADRSIERDRLASRTDHRLVLVEIEIVKDEWETRQAINERMLEHNAAVELRGCL